MEIKRIGENKIRCALTEDEIQNMGFDIDDIIGNTETTQQFMRVVLHLVEEQENISLENVSPMVKAELLQDHSMAITFGGDSDLTFQSLVDTVNHLLGQMHPEGVQELAHISAEDKRAALAELLEKLHPGMKVQERTEQAAETPREPLVCALQFASIENMISMSRACSGEKMPNSSLYRMDGNYYLVVDFTGMTKDEMRPYAFAALEYGDAHFSGNGRIAYIKEQGKCIMRKDAVQMLMQL